MILFRCLITSGIVITAATGANAGVRFDFRGGERADFGRPFNFAVSTTSHNPVGVWTAEDFSGENLGPKNRRLSVRPSLQVSYKERGAFDIFRASSKSPKRREGGKTPSAGSINAGGFLPGFSDDAFAVEQTNGQRPVNAGYCYCPEKPGDDDDDDDGGIPGDDDDDGQTGGGDDDDDDDGQTGGGDDDDDDDDGEGEGGGPDPSVVPEPGSFALWALAGALLIGVTRRQTTES